MLTAAQIAALGEAARQITDPITEYLLQDITRRVAEAGRLTSTAQYQIWRARQLGVSQREIKKELRRRLGLSHREIGRIMYQSARSGYDLDIRRFPYVQALPFARNAELQQIVSAAAELAEADFTNIVQTVGFVTPYGRTEPLTRAYITSCDFAFKQVITGAASYTEAVRQATRNLAEKGVRVIDYESGVHTSLEAAVRRNIMGGLGLLQEQVSQVTHDQLGCNGWEISAHANSAPDHEPIQGKQYPDREYEALNNSLRRRIGTLNCGHTAFPIILGVNRPQHTPEELEQFRADNQKGVTVEGRHYTGYEATQMQRKLERSIRAQKRRVMIDEAAGDSEKLAQDKTRLTLLRQRYARFSKAAGLKTQYERTETAGFGEKTEKNIAKPAESNILNSTGYEPVPVTEESIERIPRICPAGWSQEQAERLQEAHRELLRLVKDRPLGTEVGAVYFPDMLPISQPIVGEPCSGHVRIPSYDVPNIVIHSHPDGEIFSPNDIENFILSGGIEMMTVVGNNGVVYVVRKTTEYDGFLAHQQYMKLNRVLSECVKSNDVAGCIQAIMTFLEEGCAYGLEFIKGGA